MSSRINPMSFFQYLSDGLISVYLSRFSTVSFCQCLIMRILLMSSRIELLRLLADVFLVSSIDVFHEVSPNVFCQICLKGSLDVFPDQPNVFLPSVCLMGLISVYPSWLSPVFSANVYDENPADVCPDWIHLFSCQCLCR